MLPPQLIFQGKTDRVLPHSREIDSLVDSEGWLLSHTENHWASLGTLKEWLRRVVAPYQSQVIARKGLPEDQPVVILLGCWSVHCYEEWQAHVALYYPWIHLIFVPANCTSKAQPLDVGLNKPFKSELTEGFNDLLAAELAKGKGLPRMGMQAIKTKVVTWIKTAIDHIRANLSSTASARRGTTKYRLTR
jgi:hypothetical protein